MFSEDERQHNDYSPGGRGRERGHNLLPQKQAVVRSAFRPMDKTRTVVRGAQPSYTDPADKGAETAQNCALTGAGM